MTEVLAFYQKQAQLALHKNPLLAAIQQQGVKHLFELGFPQRKDEHWKYTQLNEWRDLRFVEASTETSAIGQAVPLSDVFPVHLVDGSIHFDVNAVPEGLECLSLQQAATQAQSLLEQYLDTIVSIDHGFQAQNSAMLSKGLLLHVPANTHVTLPVYLAHHQTQDEQSVHVRHLIVLEANSSLTLIEDYHGVEGRQYFTNTLTEVHLAAGAKLEHYTIQRESRQATHIGHMAVQQMRHSHLSHHSISIGGKLVRSDIQVDFREEEAACLLNGVYAPCEGQHVDHHLRCSHHVGHCNSEQNYKGILSGKSRAVFNGIVFVEKNAQKSESHQYNKNILLSAHAEVDTKPQLEIYADDVICSHGATVGQLDEDALFYLATRGISAEQASQFLIQAFAADNFQQMPNAKVAEWMQRLLKQQMEC